MKRKLLPGCERGEDSEPRRKAIRFLASGRGEPGKTSTNLRNEEKNCRGSTIKRGKKEKISVNTKGKKKKGRRRVCNLLAFSFKKEKRRVLSRKERVSDL